MGLTVDSAALLTDGMTRLLNVNDCKIFGLPLRYLLRHHGPIDFTLRSYSSAHPIPYCVEGYERHFADLRRPHDYIEDFTSFCLHVGTRYAVPFASNHCFLHKETRRFNVTAVSPEAVADHYARRARDLGIASECVVMSPGSSWSDTSGFALRPFDYSRRDEVLEELAERNRAKLERHYALEAETLADWDAFAAYFDGFLRALPPAARWSGRSA